MKRSFLPFWIVSLCLTYPLAAADLPLEPGTAESVVAGDWEADPPPEGSPWGVNARAKGAGKAGGPLYHVVAKKDTLMGIVRKYGISLGDLKARNGLKTDVIQPGQKLIVGETASVAVPVESPPGPSPEPMLNGLAQQRTDTVRLQVFLDRRQFCPGRIDGLSGQFMRSALARIRSVEPALADEAALLAAAAKEVPEPWTTYPYAAKDAVFVGDYASGWPVLAAQKFLSYRSAWEFVAERYHVSEDFLRQVNPQLKDRTIVDGDRFVVPAVDPFKVEDVFPKRAALFGKKGRAVHGVIRQKELVLDLMRGEQLIASFPITLGKPETRGKGEWTVAAKVPRPTYSKRPRATDSAEARGRHFTLQPGPNNPVGVLWMSLRKPGSSSISSQGLHGTYTPDTIGRATSLGCIRMANWDIVRAAKLLEEGSTLSWK